MPCESAVQHPLPLPSTSNTHIQENQRWPVVTSAIEVSNRAIGGNMATTTASAGEQGSRRSCRWDGMRR